MPISKIMVVVYTGEARCEIPLHYRDVDLDRISFKYGLPYISDRKANGIDIYFRPYYHSTGSAGISKEHPQISFMIDDRGETAFAVKRGVTEQEGAFFGWANNNPLFIRQSPLEDTEYIAMDLFMWDLQAFLRSETPDLSFREKFIDFGVDVIRHLFESGYCFTDLKSSQILMRPYSSVRKPFYKRIDDWEVAVTDLDIGLCENKSRHRYTFPLPKPFPNTAEFKTKWALTLYMIQVLDAELFEINASKATTASNLVQLVHRIDESPFIQEKYKYILYSLLNPDDGLADAFV